MRATMSGGSGSASDTQTYEAESLIAAAKAHAKHYQTLRGQFHTLRQAFQQIEGLGPDFQGKGAEAIKKFYAAQVNVVDAWLRLIDKKVAYYQGVAGTVEEKNLDGDTQIQVPFLNEDLSMGYARSKEMVREQRMDISKILSSISDLVPINVFSNHEVDQALDAADKKRAQTVLDVQDLDQNLTNEYRQVNEDLPYIASLYGELINATRQGAEVQPMNFNAQAYHNSKVYQVQDEMKKETQNYLHYKQQQEKVRELEKNSEKEPIENLAQEVENKVIDSVDQVADNVKQATNQAGKIVDEIKDDADNLVNSAPVQGAVHFAVGAGDQVIENNTGLEKGHQEEWGQFNAYKSGELAGDVLSAFEGIAEMIGGGTLIGGGTTLSVAGAPETLGASLALEPGALAVGTAAVGHGGFVTANGFKNSINDIKNLKQNMSVEKTSGGAKKAEKVGELREKNTIKSDKVGNNSDLSTNHEVSSANKKASGAGKGISIPTKKLDGLPENVTKSYKKYDKSGWNGNAAGQSSGTKAGSVFKNRDGKLPTIDKNGKPVTYQEFDVNSKLPDARRDSERFIKGSDDNLYYTDDHYESFVKIE
ncbi:MAG: T7SS effector LXG polymorphic toxin [Sporolactobacillus sp.]